MKIVHISDIHIKNFKNHDEYLVIFERLYQKIREIKPDLIINTGDTAHTKLSISPAWVQVTANLFKNLADLAPYHIILGNHDLNLKNPTKLDAISPIVSTLNHPNIFLHKNSEVFSIQNFKFYVLSIIDEENWKFPVDNQNVNIALFHGSVKGAKTDLGWALEEGNISVDVLNRFDYALLGDIHTSNQSVNESETARYAGSLVQQNFGETINNHGMLLWDLKTKTSKLIEVPNDYIYKTHLISLSAFSLCENQEVVFGILRAIRTCPRTSVIVLLLMLEIRHRHQQKEKPGHIIAPHLHFLLSTPSQLVSI